MPVVIDVPTEDGVLLTAATFKRNLNGIRSMIYGTCFCPGAKITEWFYLFVASFFSSRELMSPAAFPVIC